MISKKISIALLVSMASVLVQCDANKTPASMISSPLSTVENQNDNTIKMVNEFIPKNAKLTIPNNLQGSNGIQSKDLNGDGKDEVVAFYKTNESSPKVGIIVLKQINDSKWDKIYDTKSEEAYEVDYLKLADVDGDGKDDIVAGWTISGQTKGLDILSLKDDGVKRIVSDYYSKIDVEDMADINGKTDGKAEIGLWVNDTGEAYVVDALRWNGSALKSAKDVYPNYFKKVVAYYQGKVKESPDAPFYWYYLADAQIKVNDMKDALTSINKGLELSKQNPKSYPGTDAFEELKKAEIK